MVSFIAKVVVDEIKNNFMTDLKVRKLATYC